MDCDRSLQSPELSSQAVTSPAMPPPRMTTRGRPGSVREEVIGGGGVTRGECRGQVTSRIRQHGAPVVGPGGRWDAGEGHRGSQASDPGSLVPGDAYCLPQVVYRHPRVLAGIERVPSPVAEQLGQVEVLPGLL